MHWLAILAGSIGGLFTMSMAVPQAWTIWRDRSRVGVSELTWWLFCMSFCLWIGYTIREANTIVAISNFCALATGIVLLAGIYRADPRTRSPYGVVGIGLVVGVTLVGGGLRAPLLMVFPLLMAAGLVRVPQMHRSLRTWREGTSTEVSVLTWWASLAAGVCWTIHGLLWPDVAVVVVSISAVVISAFVLAFEYAAGAGRGHAVR